MYKEVIVWCSIILWSVNVGLSQPAFKVQSNMPKGTESKSFIWNHLGGKYEYVSSYSVWCAQGNVRKFFVFAYKQGKWEKMLLYVYYKSSDLNNDNIKKVKSKKQKVKEEVEMDSLVHFWNQNKLWELNTDSINISQIEVGKPGSFSAVTTINIQDGCNHVLEVFDANGYFWVSGYEPEKYQKKIPVKQRELFITCKNQFVQYWNSVR